MIQSNTHGSIPALTHTICLRVQVSSPVVTGQGVNIACWFHAGWCQYTGQSHELFPVRSIFSGPSFVCEKGQLIEVTR